MYQQFYGLKCSPFDLFPKGDLVYLSESHEEALSLLHYGIVSNKGFVVLTGGVGTGKTTLLNALQKVLEESVHVCLMSNPTLSCEEFYSYLAARLGFENDGNKSDFLLQFSGYMDSLVEAQEQAVIIIDEAQTLSVAMLEEIRLLSNVSGNGCLSIFLVGQPELQKNLEHPQLLPLRQRVGASYHLQPLTREDTAQYITFRLAMAGAQNTAIFTDGAIGLVYKETAGIPRLINLLCDHAMLIAFSLDTVKIDKDMVKKSVKEVLWLDVEKAQSAFSRSSGKGLFSRLLTRFFRR